jgi:hypothetical protein
MILNRKFILRSITAKICNGFILNLREQKRSNLFVMDLKFCGALLANGHNYFVENGFTFLKFNFSHNGMGLEDAVNLRTLDKFAVNTLGKEMEDIKTEQFIVKLPVIFL